MPENEFEKPILCIGAGYVGGSTMAMIAAKRPRYQVHDGLLSIARGFTLPELEFSVARAGIQDCVTIRKLAPGRLCIIGRKGAGS